MIAKSVEDIRGEIVQRKLNLFEVPPNTYIMTVSVPGESAPFDEEFDKTIKNALRDYELFENNYKSIMDEIQFLYEISQLIAKQ